MSKIRALQIGATDWNQIYTIPEHLDITYSERYTEEPEKSYDLVFWDRMPKTEELRSFYAATRAYTLYVTESVILDEQSDWLYESKQGQRIAVADIQRFLLEESGYYFERPYGEKYQPNNLALSRNFQGTVHWDGQYAVSLEGNFGEDMQQLAYWRNNIPVFPNQVIDLWLEYKKTPGIEIELVVTHLQSGSLSTVLRTDVFTEEELAQVVQMRAYEQEERIFIALHAKGTGKLDIIALHDRYSRGSHGVFLPGGDRYVTYEREEVFCYFDPMDMQPPLNIYFSGYKTAEGFEGHRMMQKKGCPYLLISESRLEGGGFYMGSKEYEQLIEKVIREYMDCLGFTSNQVIMSGLSMGTFGAMYYGCKIQPHALILGKPLASIGDVAANEQRFRPGGFPTSLDVLHYNCGSTLPDAVERLNTKFWDYFDETTWKHTKFIVAYMIEDDYDNTAYEQLLSHIQTAGVELYGKGLHGRHNDNTGGIVNWFSRQFDQILIEDFEREK